jgi:hypothetical protein
VAITGVDSLIAGLLAPREVSKAAFTGEAAGERHSSFYLAGLPGAAAAPSPGVNGAALTTYAGQIDFPAAVSGANVYLAGLDVVQGANVGSVALLDRLWHNSGLTVTTTTSQSITSPAWPARDIAGSTNGAGIGVAIEVSTATTNGSAITNTTLSYTNSDGTAGKTGTITSFPATAVAGTFVPFALAAGDKGVRSVQSVTLGTSYGGGAIHLVAYRPIAVVGTPVAGVSVPLAPGRPVRMYDTSVPWLVYVLAGTAGGVVSALVQYTQG